MLLPERVRVGRLAAEAAKSSGIFGALRPSGIASFLLDVLGQQRNPSLVLRFHAHNTPDKVAVVDGETRLSYRVFDERVNRLATAFAKMGLRRGDRVAIMMRNCHEY